MLYLYRHIRLDTNVPFYIGIGSYRKNRKDTYERAYSKSLRSIFWNRIVAKTDYRVEIMLENLSREEACAKECEFISLYGRRDLGTGTLVNMTNGGDGVFNLSPESRKVMSEKAKISSVGRLHSQETKELLSRLKKGVKLSPEHKIKITKILETLHESNMIKIERYDLITGETIESYNSIREAAKSGYSETNISELINHKRNLKSHKGFGWRRSEINNLKELSNDL